MPNRSIFPSPIRLLLAALTMLLVAAISPAYPEAGFDINTADAAALAAELPGIGPVKAGRIVAHRLAHGPFTDLASLMDVPGIGPKTLESIREHLGATPLSPRPAEDDVRATPLPATDDSPIDASPRSTSELEAETRAAVQAVIDQARADAVRARSPNQ